MGARRHERTALTRRRCEAAGSGTILHVSHARPQRKSFVDRVFDGDARIDQFAAEVRAWQAGDQKRPLHEALGLDADELLLVARSPDALRYLLHARRFCLPRPGSLLTQSSVDGHAMRLAADVTDLHLLAELEDWRLHLGDRRTAGDARDVSRGGASSAVDHPVPTGA